VDIDARRTHQVIWHLSKLYDEVRPQQRGQIVQSLLEFTLEIGGYSVTPNYIGVPDLRAAQRESGAGFAIECKTGNPVVVSERDLKGIQDCQEIGVLASFVYPAIQPHWWLTDGNRLRVRSWAWWELGRLPTVDLGFDVDDVFVTLVNHVPVEVLMDREALVEWAGRRRRAGWQLAAPHV
jgi:hypothetical protein